MCFANIKRKHMSNIVNTVNDFESTGDYITTSAYHFKQIAID